MTNPRNANNDDVPMTFLASASTCLTRGMKNITAAIPITLGFSVLYIMLTTVWIFTPQHGFTGFFIVACAQRVLALWAINAAIVLLLPKGKRIAMCVAGVLVPFFGLGGGGVSGVWICS